MSKYYITTAIDYVNARPHLGTAYEKIGADCLARYKRMAGFDTYFLMGTDEHSTNVEKEAVKLGKDPQSYADEMAVEFERTWKALHISYDQFIRTSDPLHVSVVQELFERIHKNGYIYLGEYGGWYCESCEEFKVEKDLVGDHECPRHKTKAVYLEEKNLFFALSKFSDKLKQHILDNPDFIRPATRRNEILNVIEQGLRDVSVSRVGATWGVPLPGVFSQGNVKDKDGRTVDVPAEMQGGRIYVWFDALINYLSALDPFNPDPAGREKFDRYWPCDCHIIGKDITRFHCLIWPAMLMGAGVPVAESVFAHGFVYNAGEKKSKTIGNIVDPNDLAGFFGADALRYLLLREIAYDRDGDFTVELLVTRYNTELANELGNLFSRTLSMVGRYLDGAVPAWTEQATTDYARLTANVLDDYNEGMSALAFEKGLAALWRAVQAANRYVEEQKPWALAKAGDDEALANCLSVLLQVLRLSSLLCVPFMPEKSRDMRAQLGLDDNIESLSLDEATGLAASRPDDWRSIGVSAPLFPRLDMPPDQ